MSRSLVDVLHDGVRSQADEADVAARPRAVDAERADRRSRMCETIVRHARRIPIVYARDADNRGQAEAERRSRTPTFASTQSPDSISSVADGAGR